MRRQAWRILAQIIPLGILLAAVIYAVAGWASGEIGGPAVRGEGAAAISGYRVSELHFQLGEDPGQMELVEFNLDGEAGQVQVNLNGLRSRGYSCEEISDQHWHCPLEGVSVGAVEEIVISAVSG